jgi:hypothetical protein
MKFYFIFVNLKLVFGLHPSFEKSSRLTFLWRLSAGAPLQSLCLLQSFPSLSLALSLKYHVLSLHHHDQELSELLGAIMIGNFENFGKQIAHPMIPISHQFYLE